MAAVSSHRFEILQCTFYKPSYTFPLLWKYYHILCLLSNNLYRKYHFMRYHLHAKDGRSIWWKIKVERLLSHISSTGDDGNILSTEWYFLTLTHISSPEMTAIFWYQPYFLIQNILSFSNKTYPLIHKSLYNTNFPSNVSANPPIFSCTLWVRPSIVFYQ